MEALQMAQMMADLSDLEAAESRTATAIVSANTTTGPPTTSQNCNTHGIQAMPSADRAPTSAGHHRRVASSSALSTVGSGSAQHATGSSTPFDAYIGRRLRSPPITRSSSAHGSIPGTPRGNETDSDVDRAASLIALYELRAKLKQYNDSNSLRQARDKVAALSARQQQTDSPHPPGDKPGAGTVSTSPPKPPPMPRSHSQFTFPRS